MEIGKLLLLNRLFTAYKLMLTEKQMNILSLYIEEDFSLGEISDELGISRQGVFDSIKRSEQLLLSFEEKLGLLKKEDHFKEKVLEIKEQLKDVEINSSKRLVLEKLFEEIL